MASSAIALAPARVNGQMPTVHGNPRSSFSADFGAPPAGEIPILFNDHHVDAEPSRLQQNRVLTALIRGNTILVPLRSLFEQTGATVSYDPATKTVDVSKPGSDVKVTVGRPEVVLNGESRPLDVPPQMYHGSVVVPLRVISESMGAYVQWLPERKTVVVRYIAPPPPPPAPSPTPEPAQTPAPQPSATPPPIAPRVHYEHFVVGDYLFDPIVYNELSPGNKGVGTSFALRGAVEFRFGLPWMLAGDFRSYHYPHNSGLPVPGDEGNVTVIGRYGQTFVPAFVARDTDVDGRFALKIAKPRIYVGVGYLHREENYGNPKQNGFGAGLEKLPDLDRRFSVYGSIYDYPDVTANYTFVNEDPYVEATGLFGTTAKFSDRVLRYQIGASLMLAGVHSEFGLFVDGGYLGDAIHAKSLAPSNASHNGAYAGVGLKF